MNSSITPEKALVGPPSPLPTSSQFPQGEPIGNFMGTTVVPADSEPPKSLGPHIDSTAPPITPKITTPFQQLPEHETLKIKNNLYFRQLVDDLENRRLELSTFCREHGAYAVAKYAEAYQKHLSAAIREGMGITLTDARDNFVQNCLSYPSHQAHDEHAGYREFEQLLHAFYAQDNPKLTPPLSQEIQTFVFKWGTKAGEKYAAKYLETYGLGKGKDFIAHLKRFVAFCSALSHSNREELQPYHNEAVSLYNAAPMDNVVLLSVKDTLEELSLQHMQEIIIDGAAALNPWKDDIDFLRETAGTALEEATMEANKVDRAGEEIISSCRQLNQEHEASGSKAPINVKMLEKAISFLLKHHVGLEEEEQQTAFNEAMQNAGTILESLQQLETFSSAHRALLQKFTKFLTDVQTVNAVITTAQKIAEDTTDQELAMALKRRADKENLIKHAIDERRASKHIIFQPLHPDLFNYDDLRTSYLTHLLDSLFEEHLSE